MRSRRGDLPLDRDASGRLIPLLVGVMVYLAALAVVSGMAMHRAVGQWEAGLTGRVTVQIPAPVDEESPSANVDEVLDILRGTPGVGSAEVLSDADLSRLIEPWLGGAAATTDLPLPTLIAVTMEPGGPGVDAIHARIAPAAPEAYVDDHQEWLGSLRSVAQSIQVVAALVVLLVGICAITIVIFATRMGLSVHSHVIELLHLIGALDSYVARQFQAHALKMSLRGGLVGLILAILSVLLVDQALHGADVPLLPVLPIRGPEISALALLPLLIAMVAMVTARLTVLRTLSRMP